MKHSVVALVWSDPSYTPSPPVDRPPAVLAERGRVVRRRLTLPIRWMRVTAAADLAFRLGLRSRPAVTSFGWHRKKVNVEPVGVGPEPDTVAVSVTLAPGVRITRRVRGRDCG